MQKRWISLQSQEESDFTRPLFTSSLVSCKSAGFAAVFVAFALFGFWLPPFFWVLMHLHMWLSKQEESPPQWKEAMWVHPRTGQRTAACATVWGRRSCERCWWRCLLKKSARKGSCSVLLVASQSFKRQGPKEAFDLWPRLCPVIAITCCTMGRRAGLT